MSLKSLLSWVTTAGLKPTDSDDEKLRKSSLAVMSLPFAAAGFIWGVMYFANDLWIPGWIPFSYGILSVVSFLHFAKTKEYRFFRSSQLILILILPFLLQLSLGGFMQSSAVVMWAFICPLGALVFLESSSSKIWYGAFIAILLVAYLLNDLAQTTFNYQLSEEFINLVFLLNIIGVSILIFTVQVYFVSNQTKLKEAVEEQAIKLREMDEVKSRFFANISHEFRTPLTLIRGLLDKQLSQQQGAETTQELSIMKQNTERLHQLIDQLLDISKIESGELKLQLRHDNLSLFIRQIVGMFESLATNKNIALECSIDEQLSISFDADKLYKMLTNLLSNAMKFTPEGGNVSVLQDTNVSEGNVCITVSNTGSTIPQENLTHVFDRFYQVDSASTRSHEGTGIGLSLVKELAVLHHGQVQVTSDANGTAFQIFLPLTDEVYQSDDFGDQMGETTDFNVAQAVQKDRSQPSMVHSGEDELVILVVEDNPDLQYYVGDILSNSYQVHQAMNGREGLEKAQKVIPDLVISDVMMPEMDGYELCEKLKTNELTDHIPVIMLTAKADKAGKLEGLETGADDYLTKPFDKEELLIRINNLIKLRQKLQLKFSEQVSLKPDEVKADSIQAKFLNQVKGIIEENLSNDQFSVDDLSEAVGMSRSQLHRKLKALTDQPTTQFIRHYRLYRAADLLKQNSGTVSEIAYAVGFSSQTYFSSSFKELFGHAPSEISNS